MHLPSLSTLAVLAALTGGVIGSEMIEIESSESTAPNNGVPNFHVIKLPDEIKEAISPPSFMSSWDETDFAILGSAEPFEYALNMSYLDIAKLHFLNTNSGKFLGNDYAFHQASFKGNLSELTIEDVAYLYYINDELVLDYSIPFYTWDETRTAQGDAVPTFEPLIVK